MNIASVIDTTYNLSSVLRVCARSLEGDAPHIAGDEATTAHTLKMAQDMAGDVISALERMDMRCVQPHQSVTQADCAATLFEQWKAARQTRNDVLKSLGPDHKDDPVELESLDNLMGALGGKISYCKPQSNADAAAMLEWCILDCDGAILCDDYPRAQNAVIEYLRTAS